MILRIALAVLLAAAPCWPQETQGQTAASSQSQDSQSPPPASQVATIPAGARIPLTLTNQITTKSRRGDAIRAMTAFPVTVDTQVAIPVGTYVEGVIDSVNRRTPSVEIHFTRLVFSSGYTVSLQAESVQANMIRHDEASPTTAAASASTDVGPAHEANSTFHNDYWPAANSALASPGHGPYIEEAAFGSEPQPASLAFPAATPAAFPAPLPQQQPPQLQPPPPLHSHIGLAIGIGVATTAGFILALVLAGHRRGAINGVVFDDGWQFQMVLQNPLTLDLSRISATSPEPSTAVN